MTAPSAARQDAPPLPRRPAHPTPPPEAPRPLDAAGSVQDEERQADAAAPLDSLLVEGALGMVGRFLPGGAAGRAAARLATRPLSTGRRVVGLGAELTRVVRGTSQLAPAKKDKRFADAAWTSNPLLRKSVQAYLAAVQTAEDLVSDAALDWAEDQRLRFAVTNLLAALAPSNSPLLNPTALRTAVDEGGANYVRGTRQLMRDLRAAPRVPHMVDTTAFAVGGNVAVTPGTVVLRTPLFELIQYTPQTAKVRQVPLLFVPPTINKFYIVDLAPDRSMVEHFVRAGQQVFLMSWRNPDQRHADWDLDTYVQAVIDALDAVERITGSASTIPLGLCSGGIVLAMALGHLAAAGRQDRIAAASFAVTVLDQRQAGTTAALTTERVANAAKAASTRKGFVDGAQLAEVFAWLRPDDLVWNYWVNNYLLGKPPPAFDILYWNADSTRMTAGLHHGFMDLSMENKLVRPRAAQALGLPVDLSQVTVDSYLVGGIADHITPWQSCYQTTQLLGGTTRFVLSTSGHIAALVNPPSNPKANYRVAAEHPASAEDWLASADTVKGSWWTDYVAWLVEHSGDEVDAPSEPGGDGMVALAPAPGTYVCDT